MANHKPQKLENVLYCFMDSQGTSEKLNLYCPAKKGYKAMNELIGFL